MFPLDLCSTFVDDIKVCNFFGGVCDKLQEIIGLIDVATLFKIVSLSPFSPERLKNDIVRIGLSLKEFRN